MKGNDMAHISRLRKTLSAALVAMLVGLTTPSYASYTFNTLDLWGNLDLSMQPVAINNAGQIAVRHPIDDMASQIVNWRVGQAPTISRPASRYIDYKNPPPGAALWFAITDINNKGDIAGYTWSSETACPYCPTPYRTQGGRFNEFAPSDRAGTANALNDKGQAVGALYNWEVFGAPNTPVFVDTNGSLTYLNALSHANDLNNAGVVAGDSMVGTNTQAALWYNGSIQTLGTLGGNNSFAEAINESNQVVGRAQTADGAYHGALWDNGAIVNLGMETAVSINERGEVVGAMLDSQGNSVAALWKNGVLTDLNAFLPAQFKNQGWSLINAVDINDKGWIVGILDDGNFNYLPFLLTAAVPEPEAYLMLLVGLGLIGRAHRRSVRNSNPPCSI
jgi:probable HAF family extracellular repeat protein